MENLSAAVKFEEEISFHSTNNMENIEDIFSVIITILDTILRPALYLKQKVSEAGFCFRLQVGPLDRASLCIWSRLSQPPTQWVPEAMLSGVKVLEVFLLLLLKCQIYIYILQSGE
jgi:hypothetical protein